MVEGSPNGSKILWEKEKFACYEQFLLFLQCFQKTLYCRHVKKRACFGKVLKKAVRYCPNPGVVWIIVQKASAFCSIAIISEDIYFKVRQIVKYVNRNLYNQGM